MEANLDRNDSVRRRMDAEYSEELNKNSNDDDEEDERPPVPGRLSRRPSIFTAPIAGTYCTYSLHVLTLYSLQYYLTWVLGPVCNTDSRQTTDVLCVW
jgi:hypothetical protein